MPADWPNEGERLLNMLTLEKWLTVEKVEQGPFSCDTG